MKIWLNVATTFALKPGAPYSFTIAALMNVWMIDMACQMEHYRIGHVFSGRPINIAALSRLACDIAARLPVVVVPWARWNIRSFCSGGAGQRYNVQLFHIMQPFTEYIKPRRPKQQRWCTRAWLLFPFLAWPRSGRTNAANSHRWTSAHDLQPANSPGVACLPPGVQPLSPEICGRAESGGWKN